MLCATPNHSPLVLYPFKGEEDEGQADEDGGLMIVTRSRSIPVALLVPMNLSSVNLDSAENLKRLSFRSTRVFPLFFSLHVACTCVPWGFRFLGGFGWAFGPRLCFLVARLWAWF
ncbi:hypothetical protein Bca4012_002044 [Brassica carinata]